MSGHSSTDIELVDSLTAKLEELHATLTPKEQRILELLARAAADPVTRMGMRDSDSLFSPEEQSTIEELVRQRGNTIGDSRSDSQGDPPVQSAL
ncbi:helix-turn-helix domain-containing protein [Nocardia suismassiliense]|uniref:helix-turn-helix domain-containing protein n=1 Tax=Nocardia suismassiliense TaxID=2077092 RepID=UPI000D1E5B5A|nr:response regulator transcription factor [Nocardia suismassiliense]